MRTGDVLSPTAADILCTQVSAGAAPRVELVQTCVDTLQRRPRSNEFWLACDTTADLLYDGKDPLQVKQDPKQDPKLVAKLAPLAATWRKDCADVEVSGQCMDMLYFMETGANPRARFEKASPKIKSTELEFGKGWLAACAASKSCAP